ncbi:hypothetical protein WJX79_002150 [Trebouxia sp. C0005]
MHVTYIGDDAVPLQQDTEMMSAQDTWLRKYHELWEKLDEDTKSSFCTALWKWLEMVDKKSKDPFGTIRVARKAFSKIRELQRGVPPPYGEQFSTETLIKSASNKAFAATTEARIGPHSDPLRDGFQATSLDSDEVVRLLDACIRHQDHFNGFKVAAMVLLGTAMGESKVQYYKSSITSPISQAQHHRYMVLLGTAMGMTFIYSMLTQAHAGSLASAQLSIPWWDLDM